ncbi:DUF4383 domain-containing protein [Actinophytocola glycyrrhizae]|uniref:DUF4383 domain-containing protein n=1 Tax=Actinophytocola glycyrrhizae TaxID=2044873 RepID=A0ABV9S274_9PSEU
MGETTTPLGRPEPGRIASAAAGAVFLLVGVLGFIPGVTTGLDGMTFAGHESTAELFGVFAVSVLHNLVHLAFGVAGLALATTARGARVFLVGGGLFYLALFAYGLVVDASADIVPVNAADNWLHLFLAASLLALAFLAGTPRRSTNTPIHAPN